MTTIVEEHEGELAAPDFSQLLDLGLNGEGNFASSSDALFGDAIIADTALQGYCPDHPDDDTKYVGHAHVGWIYADHFVSRCWCNSFMGEWNIPQASTTDEGATGIGLEEPDYSRTESMDSKA